MYAGQMLKPPAPVAWAAYATAMLLNPNNHALDGGPATAELEREAVEQLRVMLGVPAPGLGHLTSSGTVANLEALWVARELTGGAHRPVVGRRALHPRAHVRRAGGRARGRGHRRPRAHGPGRPGRPPGAAAAWAPWWPPWAPRRWARWTTPAAIADLCAEHGARLHVDTAYGGFFALLADGGRPRRGPGPVRGHRPRRLGGDRPAQARPPALRLRLRAVRRPRRGPPVRARLALHLLHLARPAPGRDQPGVLTRGRVGGRAVDHAARAAADAGGPGRGPGRLPRRGAGAGRPPATRDGAPRARGRARAGHRLRPRAGRRRRARLRSLAQDGLARGHAAHRSGHGAAVLPAQARAPGRGRRAGRGHWPAALGPQSS